MIKVYFIFDFNQFQSSAQNFYTPESIHQYFAGKSKRPNKNNINAINNNNNTNLTATTTLIEVIIPIINKFSYHHHLKGKRKRGMYRIYKSFFKERFNQVM